MLVVNLIGVLAIVAIAWWFWWPRHDEAVAAAEIVVADGVYAPARVAVEAGKPATLVFLRKDPTACAEQVVFPDLGIARDLAVDRRTPVELPPLEPGEYAFTCQMAMYRGQLVVR